MKISATGKRRVNQLICTNLATPSGFSWNQLEPRNSNSPRIFWTDLVYIGTGRKLFSYLELQIVFHSEVQSVALKRSEGKTWSKNITKTHMKVENAHLREVPKSWYEYSDF